MHGLPVGVAQPHQPPPAQDRVAREGGRGPRRPRSVRSSRPRLAVELHRVAPQHPVDVVVAEPGRPASPRRSPGQQRVGDAPVGGRVDQHPLRPVLAAGSPPSAAATSSCPGRWRSPSSSRSRGPASTVTSLRWSTTTRPGRDARLARPRRACARCRAALSRCGVCTSAGRSCSTASASCAANASSSAGVIES